MTTTIVKRREPWAYEAINLEEFEANVIAFAKEFKMECNEARFKRVIAAFRESLMYGGVFLKYTNKPGDDLFYRFYSDVDPTWPTKKCLELDLVDKLDMEHPIHKLWTEIVTKLPKSPALTDFSLGKGFSKRWFTYFFTNFEDVYTLEHLPSSVVKYKELFKKYNFMKSPLPFIGLDYTRNSVNLYVKPLGGFQHRVKDFIKELQFDGQIDDEEMDIIANKNGILAITFRWDAPDTIERICLYAVTRQSEWLSATPEKTPFGKFDKNLIHMIQRAPSLMHNPTIAIGRSFGVSGAYDKVDFEYCGESYDNFNMIFMPGDQITALKFLAFQARLNYRRGRMALWNHRYAALFVVFLLIAILYKYLFY